MGGDGALHVLVFVYPVHGRIIPAMVLASRLVDSGARVSFLYPAHHESRLCDARSRPHSPEIRFVALHARDFDSAPNDFSRDFFLMPSLAQEFEQLVSSLQPPPSCLISDEVCGTLAKSARLLGIPRYILVPESASAFAATLLAPSLARDSKLPLQVARNETVDIPFIGMTVVAREYLSPYLDTFPWRADYFLEGAIEAQASDGILVNTYRELEPSILSGMVRDTCLNPHRAPVFAVGPLIPEPSSTVGSHRQEEEAEIMEFLDAQAPSSVVFVSFGTLIQRNEKDAREILSGLEQSGHPFIWKFSGDGDYVPTGAEKSGLILRNWAPQLRILSHPSTGSFLTHCGWNSCLESSSLGVPILGFPAFMDQPINCKLLVELRKAGVKLATLESFQIAEAIKEVMESEEIRRNAQKLKLAADRAPKSLDFFVDKLREKSALHYL
ncbi:linamarin synthase 2 [Selaginella moellendorffii]|nr:linamarin synthase 2 [Selaginella moellendorffii]|eukprot:XP_002982152.2 linamarin synthase 2 [Selaginella moellendorffii]